MMITLPLIGLTMNDSWFSEEVKNVLVQNLKHIADKYLSHAYDVTFAQAQGDSQILAIVTNNSSLTQELFTIKVEKF